LRSNQDYHILSTAQNTHTHTHTQSPATNMTVSCDVLVINQYNEANKNTIQSQNMLKHVVMTFIRHLCSTALAGNTEHSNFKQKPSTAK
jgi:hypothetical protein